jgi:gliding motility-associated-like protein
MISPLHKLLFAAVLTLATSGTAHAQASACPAVNAGIDQTICGGCTNLTATVQGTVATSSYTLSTIPYNPYSYTAGPQVLVNIDDIWTPVVNIPFCFEFYGNTYTQLIIGSNGLISFDISMANAYCEWDIMADMPNTTAYDNVIMAPYYDIDPSVGATSEVHYNTYGTAPCREFVISWYNVPLYSCNSVLGTQQIVLHESTNIIDIYIQNKPGCAWNENGAVEGIINLGGTQSVIVPGRNYSTPWTTTNDGRRFVPAGAPNYTITWTGPSGPIGNTTTVNVCPTVTTTYTATVTNSSCAGPIVVTDQVTVTINSSLTASAVSTPSACTANNGTATAVPSGGTGPYTYSWAPSGGTSATATGLAPGNYTVTVTDLSTGCVATQTVNVANTGNVSSTPQQTDNTCASSTNGSATVNVSGGTGPFTYAWNPNVSATQTASNLAAGTYSVLVTDANGCTTSQSFNITAPPALTASTTQTNVTCFGGSDGSAVVTVGGGSPGYTYQWSTGGNSQTETGLVAGGPYVVMVTDLNGCTITQSVSITEPPVIDPNTSSSPVNCTVLGSAAAQPSGGTGSYTYLWAPSGGTAASESNLNAGTYTVTVTDANGCTATETVTVTQVATMTVSATSTDATCFGGSTGTASVTPTGGNGPFTYQWSPTGGNNASATGLAAGTYTCLITDSQGCTATQTVLVSEPTQVSGSTSSIPASCFGGSDGSVSAVGSGGTPGYNYTWSPAGPSSLPAGTYTCTITDANGCTSIQTATVSQATQITGSSSGVAPTCNGGSNGSASVTASGGTGSYTYNWSPTGGTAATATGLSAGSYTCTVTDANGCTFTQAVVVTNPPAITATGTGNQVCPGSNATIIATASGGTSPYTFAWSNGPTTATQTMVATQAATGIYTVTVTDANGCTQTATAAVGLLPTPTAAFTTDATNGVVVLTAGAGTICFTDVSTGGVTTWSWDFNGQGASSVQSPCFNVTSANSGTFCTELIVTDANQCYDTTMVCVEVGQSSYSIPNVFTPNGDGTNDQFIITNEGMTNLHCNIYDRWGMLIYEWDGTTGNWDGNTSNGKPAVDGVYYYTAQLIDFSGKNYAEEGFLELLRSKP